MGRVKLVRNEGEVLELENERKDLEIDLWRKGNRAEMPDGEREFVKGNRLVDAIVLGVLGN